MPKFILRTPILKFTKFNFQTKNPLGAYSLMKASFSISAHASSGTGARICEKKTYIFINN
jgi:hypothetical protein